MKNVISKWIRNESNKLDYKWDTKVDYKWDESDYIKHCLSVMHSIDLSFVEELSLLIKMDAIYY